MCELRTGVCEEAVNANRAEVFPFEWFARATHQFVLEPFISQNLFFTELQLVLLGFSGRRGILFVVSCFFEFLSVVLVLWCLFFVFFSSLAALHLLLFELGLF